MYSILYDSCVGNEYLILEDHIKRYAKDKYIVYMNNKLFTLLFTKKLFILLLFIKTNMIAIIMTMFTALSTFEVTKPKCLYITDI